MPKTVMSRAGLVQAIAKPSRKVLTILREGMSATTALALLAVASATVTAGMLIARHPQAAVYLLGASAAVDYILLCLSEFFAAFAILVLFALTVWLSGIQIIGGLSAMIGLGVIFAGFWLTRLYFGALVFRKVKEFRLLLALAVVVVVSALLHVNSWAGLSAVPTYLQLFLLFVLVINFATTPGRLQALGGVIIASSALLAAFILLDHFGWLPTELARESTFNVTVSGGEIAVSRSSGLWGDPNITAVQLTIALPFIIAWWPAVSRPKQMLLLAAGAAILAAFVWTLSLGGLLGVSVMLLMTTMMTAQRNRRFAIVRNALIGLVALAALALLVPDLFIQRAGTTLENTLSSLGTADQTAVLRFGTGRGDAWWASLQAIAASPLLGYGPGNGMYANRAHSVLYFLLPGYGRGLSAHNMFLAVASDLGLVGLALFVALFISALRALRSLSSAPTVAPDLQRNRQAIFVALAGYAVQGMALEINNLKLLWILLGLAIASRQLYFQSLAGDVQEVA